MEQRVALVLGQALDAAKGVDVGLWDRREEFDVLQGLTNRRLQFLDTTAIERRHRGNSSHPPCLHRQLNASLEPGEIAAGNLTVKRGLGRKFYLGLTLSKLVATTKTGGRLRPATEEIF
jgi:hypothetical protein